jgi:Hypothetical glycosyl hydrolase 6/Beta-galactosidase trimerisation domain
MALHSSGGNNVTQNERKGDLLMDRRRFSKLFAIGISGSALGTRFARAMRLSARSKPDGPPPPAKALSPRLSKAYREYCFDFNWVDKLTNHVKPLSDYSSLSVENEVQDLMEMDADSLMVFCMSISGYMFYDSKVGVRHPTLKYDYLRKMIDLGHQKGIAMELYVPTMWADYLIHQHPSWGMRTPDGKLFTAAYGGYHPDPNSPASDWYVKVIHELVPAYGGDAFFADGITFLKYGQSEYTVEKFKREMGRDYPTSLDNDPDWRATLRWEVKQIENYWRRLRNAVKERDPRVEVTFNGPGPDIAMPGRVGWGRFIPEPPHLDQETDYVFTEAGSTGEYADWTRGIAYPRPFRVTFKNTYSILDPFNLDEVRARVGRTLGIGGMPYRYDRTSVNGKPDPYFVKSWGIINKEIQEKTPYVVGAEPLKYVGVVSSEPTMYYRGRSDSGCHSSDLIGALRMLDALHVQHEVVADWNLKPEFLKSYHLLILPNAACMSDEQVTALRAYVKDGGSLLATAETSLFDPDGNARHELALGDVLGIRIDEAPNNAVQTRNLKRPTYINPSQLKHPIFNHLPPTNLIIPGDSTYVRTSTGQSVAPLINDAGTPGNSPWQVTKRTAVGINHFGKGRAVYFAGSIFGQSAWRSEGSEGVHWVGQLVANTMRFLAPSPPSTAEASEKVWVGLNVQRAHKRHVLHLVDWETDLPARNVTITIAAGTGVGRKATQVWPERRPLKSEPTGSGFVTTIPEVGPHVIVLFE